MKRVSFISDFRQSVYPSLSLPGVDGNRWYKKDRDFPPPRLGTYSRGQEPVRMTRGVGRNCVHSVRDGSTEPPTGLSTLRSGSEDGVDVLDGDQCGRRTPTTVLGKGDGTDEG